MQKIRDREHIKKRYKSSSEITLTHLTLPMHFDFILSYHHENRRHLSLKIKDLVFTETQKQFQQHI